jgi:seryl-tRNA synthetase
MLDLKLIRQSPDEVKQKLQRRKVAYVQLIDQILDLDLQKRNLQKQEDDLKSQRNSLSKSVKSKEEAEGIKQQVTKINEQIAFLHEESKTYEEKLEEILLGLPNLPAGDVPDGESEEDNKIIHSKGAISVIKNPLQHWELAEKLGILDFERTSKISGARFSTFVGKGAKLQRAIVQFFLDEAEAAGYLEMSPPAIVNQSALQGTGQLPKFKEDLYQLCTPEDSGQEQYLIPTAEVPLTGFYAGDDYTLAQDLPKRLCAYTPCFRSEAGSAGRDTRGLIRQHQFDKIELVHVCEPEQSEAEHEKLVTFAESLLEKLGLPFRRLLLCTGDMGFSAAKCYDLEVWMAGQNKYREISSCSNCNDFQARRLGFKFRRNPKDKNEFVHTLNGSGLAVGRTWAAIVENYQINDGTAVKIPQALHKYLNFDLICLDSEPS